MCRYGAFSQFYEASFIDESSGQKYGWAEQWMMQHKALLFGDTEIAGKILSTTEPKSIKALGRAVKGFTPELWDKHKYDIVVSV